MKPLGTFNLGKLIKLHNPFSPGTQFICTLPKKIDCFTKSLISNQRLNLPLLIEFQPNQVKLISTSVKLQSDTYSSYDFENKKNSEDECENYQVSSEADKKFSTYKYESIKQEEFLVAQLQSAITRTDRITNEDWIFTRNSVLEMVGEISEQNIDAIIMNKCSELKSLSLGKSYFKFLKSTQKPINRATYGNYLRLFYVCACDCTSDDLTGIENTYKELLQVYPLLDSYTAEKAIYALSLTKDWREFEKLFSFIRKVYKPSVTIHTVVIKSAVDHKEFDLAWKMIEELQYQGINLPDEIFMHWLEKTKDRKLDEDFARVLRFFSYFNVKPSDYLCEKIRDAFEDSNQKRKGTFTAITRNGQCRSCHSKLESSYLSEQDFYELKNAFLNPVLIGKDIFQKTKPEEFSEFLNFLKNSGSFNVVLDGLNISLGTDKRSANDFTFRLKSVVKHFVNLNKTILVFGRKHMANWRTHHMSYVYDHAQVFLADNLSQDDPFILYAALSGGLGTCFVSKDMMRGHKFLLSDPKLQLTFKKWQAKHQYFISYITYDGIVRFREPVSFLQTVQQNSRGDWHIPFTINEDLTNRDKVDHLHKHWLCLQQNPPGMAQYNPQNVLRNKSSKEWESSMSTKKKTGSINIKELIQDSEQG